MSDIVIDDLFVKKVIDIIIALKPVFEKQPDIQVKGSHNYVTSVDYEIQTRLMERLSPFIPNASFVAEEKDNANSANHYVWIIDPVDGTNNFIHGFTYAISVGLAKDGITILGIVYNPVEEVLYYAIKNKGAFKIVNDKKVALISDTKTEDGILLFGIPYNRNKIQKILNHVLSIQNHYSDIKRIGPASLDICRVAEGKALMYFELDLKVWDIAAGALILEEVGGKFIQMDDLYIFGKGNHLQEMISILKK